MRAKKAHSAEGKGKKGCDEKMQLVHFSSHLRLPYGFYNVSIIDNLVKFVNITGILFKKSKR